MKIYTKKGDSGQTSLFGGNRVSKHSLRIEAYGTVDELNSVLGLTLSLSPVDKVAEILDELQQQLFVLGSDLATPLDAKAHINRISNNEIKQLESMIDELQEYLPTLKNFILPGGSQPGASLHLARTVCRRAERMAVACSQSEPVSDESIIYLNRLSDLLFVLARFENYQSGQTETEWNTKKK